MKRKRDWKSSVSYAHSDGKGHYGFGRMGDVSTNKDPRKPETARGIREFIAEGQCLKQVVITGIDVWREGQR